MLALFAERCQSAFNFRSPIQMSMLSQLIILIIVFCPNNAGRVFYVIGAASFFMDACSITKKLGNGRNLRSCQRFFKISETAIVRRSSSLVLFGLYVVYFLSLPSRVKIYLSYEKNCVFQIPKISYTVSFALSLPLSKAVSAQMPIVVKVIIFLMATLDGATTAYTDYLGHKAARNQKKDDTAGEEKVIGYPEVCFKNGRLSMTFNKGSIISFSYSDAVEVMMEGKGESKVTENEKEREKTMDYFSQASHYKGTTNGWEISPTDEAIRNEKRTKSDDAEFTASFKLFEEQLPKGFVKLSARARIAKGGCFYVLLRFYMRVDGVLLRVCDTRIVGDSDSHHVIREWQLREGKYEELGTTDEARLLDADQPWKEFKVFKATTEKLTIV
ncbi:hypothetical protein CRE_29577 [Caenorhabditis remanei]|uniref:TIP41-like protein n=1 Tax=Caenorhabditis remanei TaxID=31234 RepID=E3LVS2_CAERE|nr:hypothetical protein CRE_29577 [Caenorhabditis remanei]